MVNSCLLYTSYCISITGVIGVLYRPLMLIAYSEGRHCLLYTSQTDKFLGGMLGEGDIFRTVLQPFVLYHFYDTQMCIRDRYNPSSTRKYSCSQPR